MAHLATHSGEPVDFEALSTVNSWLQPPSSRLGPLLQGCEWLSQPVDPDQWRAEAVRLLAGQGAEVRIASDDPAAGPPRQRALRFLQELPPQ